MYFEDEKLNYAPVIEAVVKGPKGVKSLKLLADTGFQGGVLIPLMTYVGLGLNLVEGPKVIARTATGAKVELRSARAVLEIGSVEVPCKAYTALGVTRSLAGREVLKEVGLLYKPPDELRLAKFRT